MAAKNKEFFEKVKRKDVDGVKLMIEKHVSGTSGLNLNGENKHGQTALDIAIEQKAHELCKVLIENHVRADCSVFDAIEHNQFDLVELILDNNNNLKTAFEKAAENAANLLQGAKEKAKVSFDDDDQLSWETYVLKQLFYKAMCSPQYLTAVSEEQNRDPFTFCLKLIKYIQKDSCYDLDHEAFYLSLCEQVDDYMCKLLDQVQSSFELNTLFDWFTPESFDENELRGAETKIYKQIQANQLSLLEKSCKLKLINFVTHQNSQFMLSKLLKRNISTSRDKHPIVASLKHWCLGFLFFLWPFLYLLPPWTRLGKLITSPIVVYESHLISNLAFLSLLIAYVETRSPASEYLGSPPTYLEWPIFIWVIGKIVGEIQNARNRGLKRFVKDWWNIFAIIPLVLFSAAFLARIMDFFSHLHDVNRIYRNQWRSTDFRLISVGILAVAYLFTFLSTLSFSRTSRFLGPIRVSLTKMLFNVIQFHAIFFLLMLAFTISLTELYWYTGTNEGFTTFCLEKNNSTEGICPTSDGNVPNRCEGPVFISVFSTFLDLFWALFGQLDIQCLREHRGKDTYIDDTGLFLMGIFHISIIFILLNMLIAMMTESFDRTSQNKDAEYKFYRTDIWIQFIRQDFAGPPPMNLLPDFYSIYVKIKKGKWLRCCQPTEIDSPFDDAVKEYYANKEQKHLEVSLILVKRHKTKLMEQFPDIN